MSAPTPARVPAATTNRVVASTAPRLRGTAPNQRWARASAPSTAKANSGTSNTDPSTQLRNGPLVRSVAPTAPRSATTQNQSAVAITTAKLSTVVHGMAVRPAGRMDALTVSGTG